MADEKIAELEKDRFPISQIILIEVNYYAPNSSCVIAWKQWIANQEDPINYSVIEDLTTGKQLGHYNKVLSEIPSHEFAVKQQTKFEEQMKKYFGEDSE